MAKRLNSAERAVRAKKVKFIKDGVITFSLALTMYGGLAAVYAMKVWA